MDFFSISFVQNLSGQESQDIFCSNFYQLFKPLQSALAGKNSQVSSKQIFNDSSYQILSERTQQLELIEPSNQLNSKIYWNQNLKRNPQQFQTFSGLSNFKQNQTINGSYLQKGIDKIFMENNENNKKCSQVLQNYLLDYQLNQLINSPQSQKRILCQKIFLNILSRVQKIISQFDRLNFLMDKLTEQIYKLQQQQKRQQNQIKNKDQKDNIQIKKISQSNIKNYLQIKTKNQCLKNGYLKQFQSLKSELNFQSSLYRKIQQLVKDTDNPEIEQEFDYLDVQSEQEEKQQLRGNEKITQLFKEESQDQLGSKTVK